MSPSFLSDQELHRELVEHRNTLHDLIDVARVQLQLIDAEDFDGLWKTQMRKEPLVARLGAGRPAETSLRVAWERRRDAMPIDLRRRCERLIDESAELLESLMEEERICRTALDEKMASTRRELALAMQGVHTLQQRRQSDQAAARRTIDFET